MIFEKFQAPLITKSSDLSKLVLKSVLDWNYFENVELKCRLGCGFDLFQTQLTEALRSRHS